jgi:hypothetical protein
VHVQADVVGTVDGSRQAVEGCGGERCSSWDAQQIGGLRLGVDIARIGRVWIQGGIGKTELSGTGHTGTGRDLAAGVLLTAPTQWTPMLGVQVEQLNTSAEGRSSTLQREGRAFAGVAHRGDDVAWWAGADWAFSSQITLDALEDDTELYLHPTVPVSGVLGAQLSSPVLNAPWRRQSARLHAGMEVQVARRWGASVWVGVRY